MKRLFSLALACSGFLLVGGCSNTQSGPTTDVARQLAASYLSARALDRVQLSLRQGNDAQLERAGQDLQFIDAHTGNNFQMVNALISTLVGNAVANDSLASGATGAERTQLREAANKKYRAALTFVPTSTKAVSQQKGLDALNLNALGYFLAERGTTQADWERAELLTRLAIERWDERYLTVEKSDANKAAILYEKAVAPQDSHAWALFKLRRFREAQTEAEQVLTVMATSSVRQEPSAEVIYHLAEIYRASGEANKSMPLYREALRLTTDVELQKQITVTLKLLSGEWRAV